MPLDYRKAAIPITLIIAALVLAVTLVYFFPTQPAGGTTSNSSSSESVSGLNLSVSLNVSSIQAGHEITLTASLFNGRSTENNLSSANNWAVPHLVIGPCGPTDSPIAFAVVMGFYTVSNISKAPTIQYGVFCTTVMGEIRLYAFQPKSDIASVIGNCNPNPCFTKSMTLTRSLDAYWSRNEIVNFTPGVYTVVVADEWGDVAVSNFTVQG